MIKVTSSSI